MSKKVLCLVLVLSIILLPLYGVSIALDDVFDDSPGVGIKLSAYFVDINPGDEVKVTAYVTGLESSEVHFILEDNDLLTLTPNGKSAIVTMDKDAKNYGEQTIKLEVRSACGACKDYVRFSVAEAARGPGFVWKKSMGSVEIFPDIYQAPIVRDYIRKQRTTEYRWVENHGAVGVFPDMVKVPIKAPIQMINDGSNFSY
ncbi:hypothetical protein EZV73_12235 [Acidaminobacter sp. JC074]|uniref:hypothetical protein n=1 Tax=Acidaminobacter sp. JC074 TaxID=2530199 RepID=UPI001F0EEB16|nr:hypothetical protein [Acidaminobacter sp. JC074]MCH4888350.1 hypothetical protein [Acidaminobacter sp. JC074]